jgi:hypothetical protein
MTNNKRIFELCEQLTAEAKNSGTTGFYRLMSKQDFEYTVRRAGTEASGILQPDGFSGLMAVACHVVLASNSFTLLIS